MDLFQILDKLKRKDMSIVLFCLLDRIPIFVIGNDSDIIDSFLIELSELIEFRKELVFNTDFVSSAEYDNLIQNENIDYNSQRFHIRCPHNVSLKALQEIDFFKSWLIGILIPQSKKEFVEIEDLIRNGIKKYLIILIKNHEISVILEGINPKELDLTLEQTILQKISQDTEKSINRMKRVVSEKVKLSGVDKTIIKTLLDFSIEKDEVKRNIFKKEILNFYSGSKRAFFILSRLNLLNNFESNTSMGSKTLLETIDYEDASSKRIISFIKQEWSEDFSELIENGKKVFIGDKIQSLWG